MVPRKKARMFHQSTAAAFSTWPRMMNTAPSHCSVSFVLSIVVLYDHCAKMSTVFHQIRALIFRHSKLSIFVSFSDTGYEIVGRGTLP